VNIIFYTIQKDLSNDVWHAPIGAHLTFALKGFVVTNQIINLSPNPFLNHNSCISSLNEQCEGSLGRHILRLIQWYFGGQNWCLFALSIKILNI